MRYSKLFGKTIKESPKDEESVNAKLLIRAGFIRKETAGIYNFLPLGVRVLKKISDIVRSQMNSLNGQELELTSLQNKSNWEQTGRWKTFDVLFKVKSQSGTEYALGPTHEEVLTPLVGHFVSSYKDLPLALYQIQTKFRDELRAKGGILRGREFLMKDLYSFHADEEDFNAYYEAMKKAYKNVFDRCGLDSILTQAGGGTFSKFSHEFQVISRAGEDEIIYCPGGDYSANVDISDVKEGKQCVLGHGSLKKAKAIEVGNIFPLKTKFSELFGLTYKDKDGFNKPVVMGCYGIGITRLMGTIVEVSNDDKGIIWPASVAPYQAHIVASQNFRQAEKIYENLQKRGIEVLYDDRENVSIGEKFADADLIGIPVRLVISERTGQKIEFKQRIDKESKLLELNQMIKKVIDLK